VHHGKELHLDPLRHYSRARRLNDEVKDETIRQKALKLIETENDLKYRKKYASLWRIT